MADVTRVLVVDDEPLARRHIRTLLAADPDVIVVGECGNGLDAARSILELVPDIVLLDIHMPEMTGFEVITAAGAVRMPAIIFVTAFDEFAVKAFDVNAVDYVLKPVDRSRLLMAVSRAKARRNAQLQPQALEAMLNLARDAQADRSRERIALKVDARHVFVGTDTIDWLEAVDDYVRVHIGKSSYLIRATLTSVDQQLPERFLRVHRSAIINADKIKEVQTTDQGEYRLVMLDGTRLPTGRSYRSAVAQLVRSLAMVSR